MKMILFRYASGFSRFPTDLRVLRMTVLVSSNVYGPVRGYIDKGILGRAGNHDVFLELPWGMGNGVRWGLRSLYS